MLEKLFKNKKPQDESHGDSDIIFKDLVYACRIGDLSKVLNIMLNTDPAIENLYVFHTDGLSPFHIVCKFQYLYIVVLFLGYGFDINFLSASGDTGLHYAVARKDNESLDIPKDKKTLMSNLEKIKHKDVRDRIVGLVEQIDNLLKESDGESSLIVKFLVLNNAGVNINNFQDLSALHLAVIRSNHGALRELVKYKKYLNLQNSEGKTALHFAMEKNDELSYDIIMEAGAKILCYTYDKDTPVHSACSHGSADVLKKYLTFIETKYRNNLVKIINSQNCYNLTGLHLAVMNGHTKCADVIFIYSKLLEVDLITVDNENYLHLAAKSGITATTQKILEIQCKTDLVDRYSNLAITYAIRKGSVEIIKLLIDANPNLLEALDEQLNTPLLLAAKFNQLEVFRELEQMNANKKAVDSKLRTSLMIALRHKASLIVEYIFETYDMTEDHRDTNGYSILHHAVICNNLEYVEKILDSESLPVLMMNSKDIYGNTPMHLAAKTGNVKILNLLTNDEIINHLNYYGNTALHMASKYGNLSCVKHLVEYGAITNRSNMYYHTPIALAASHGYVDICEYLYSKGVDLNYTNGRIVPPLHFACAKGQEEVVETLLRLSADPCIVIYRSSSRVKSGSNALDIAIDNDHENCAKLIITFADIKIFYNRIEVEPNIFDTPMKKLITKMPQLAEYVLSRSISLTTSTTDSSSNGLVYDFELIDDTFSCWKTTFSIRKKETVNKTTHYSNNYSNSGKVLPKASRYVSGEKFIYENHPLNSIAQAGHQNLLEHEAVSTLIAYKWKKYAFCIFYWNFISYLIFLILFNSFMILSRSPDQVLKNTTLDEYCQTSTNDGDYKIALFVISILLLIFCGFNLLKELVQIIRRFKDYFSSFDNYLELFIFISTILVVHNFGECSLKTGIRNHYQWQLGSMIQLVSWINFFLFLRKIPFIGIYVILFIKVSLTFLRVALVFSLFILTYGFTFMTIFTTNHSFLTPFASFIKTLDMLAGEIDYNGLFYEESAPLHYPVTSYISFISFILFMNIVLMNLLVGLAVDDISNVMSNAKMNHISLMIHLCLDIESSMMEPLLRKMIKKKYTYYPKSKKASHRFDNFIFNMVIPDSRCLDKMNAHNLMGKQNGNAEEDNDEFNLEKEIRKIRSLLESRTPNSRRLATLGDTIDDGR